MIEFDWKGSPLEVVATFAIRWQGQIHFTKVFLGGMEKSEGRKLRKLFRKHGCYVQAAAPRRNPAQYEMFIWKTQIEVKK